MILNIKNSKICDGSSGDTYHLRKTLIRTLIRDDRPVIWSGRFFNLLIFIHRLTTVIQMFIILTLILMSNQISQSYSDTLLFWWGILSGQAVSFLSLPAGETHSLCTE